MNKTDVLVIGGGINGCGVAQAAAARGLRVLLVEQGDIAAGTSSRSSKLVHGGLRYLETLRFSLVRESLHERDVLLKIAPKLVRKAYFYIPVYRRSLRPPWKIAAGLTLYRLIAGSGNDFQRIPSRMWEETLPGLSHDGLRAVFRYQDAATDDAALTRAVAASARCLGAEILAPCRMRSGRRTEYGWEADLGEYGVVEARALVNATGPWVNQVQTLLQPLPAQLSISLVQGSHIILPSPQEAYVYAEARDGRAIFMMPWKGKTMVGTTECDVDDPDNPEPGEDEINYLLDAYRRYYPSRPGDAADIEECFAGVRVLPGGRDAFARRGREARLCRDTRESPHLVAIYGGKLTIYRRTAERVMNMLSPVLRPPLPDANTAEIML